MTGPREIRSHRADRVYQGSNAITRSHAHWWIGLVMVFGIVAAGIMLDRAGREPEAIMASLSAWTALGIGVATAVSKLTKVEQSGQVVEQRTNGEMTQKVTEIVDQRVGQLGDDLTALLLQLHDKQKGRQ